MSLTPFSNHLSFSFAIQELGLVKPLAYYGKTSIWINAESYSGKPRTVILGLSQCITGFMKAYVVSTENEQVQYFSQQSSSLSHISLTETLSLWTKLIQTLSKEPLVVQKDSQYITGDHIGPAIWHSKGLIPMS